MHYYQQNIGAYRRDTLGLNMLEHGIYRTLLDTYYLDEKPLSLDVDDLMRSHGVRIEVEQEAFKYILKKFFFKGKEGYQHKRCDVEIAAFYSKSDKAKESANARWAKEKANKSTDGDANASVAHSEGNAKAMLPHNLNTSIPHIKPKKLLSGTPDDFARFWEAYPDKTGKKKCLVVWKREKPPIEQVLKTIEWQKVSQKWLEGFIPNPLTWLNEGRWDDQPREMVVVAGGKVAPWYITASGIEAKAKELCIDVGSRVMAEYKVDVYRAAGITSEMVRKATDAMR